MKFKMVDFLTWFPWTLCVTEAIADSSPPAVSAVHWTPPHPCWRPPPFGRHFVATRTHADGPRSRPAVPVRKKWKNEQQCQHLNTFQGLQWTSYQIRKIAGCACAGNARNVFPAADFQGSRLVSYPGMHHGTCVMHVPWCMSGSLTYGGSENVPGNPGACANRNFTYLARGPWINTQCTELPAQEFKIIWKKAKLDEMWYRS